MNDAEISDKVKNMDVFNMRPASILSRLKLRNPIYEETAAYGHFGRPTKQVVKTFTDDMGNKFDRAVELFTWEKLDCVDAVKQAFAL